MYVFCCFLAIIILLWQGRGEDVFDCTNFVHGKNTTQTYCKKLLDHRNARRESTAGQRSAPKEFKCQSEGRFPDLSDPTCMWYFQCERMNNETFSKKSFKCPNSTFCGSTQKCSSVYVCPCDGTTSNEMQTFAESYGTTVKTTAHPCSVSLVDNFNCLSVGRFADFNDLTCQEYFLCSHLYNGSYIKTKYKCQNSFFDPVIKRCSVNFTCPCTISTDASAVTIVSTIAAVSSTSSSSTSYSTQHECAILSKEFQCVNEGRFPDFSDMSCSKYFLCSKLRNGTFINTSYECKYSSFNPLTLRCSTDYLCPCINHTTLETTPLSSNLSSFGSVTTLPDIILTTKVVIPLSTITPLSTDENKTIATKHLLSSTVTPIVSSGAAECTASSQEFKCVAKGRFSDLTDFTCKNYFLCSQLQNGTLVKTKYRCPNGSTFYSIIHHCSSEYICPCSTVTPTITQLLTSSTKFSTVKSNPTISFETTTATYLTSPSETPIKNATILTSSLPSSSEIPACKASLDDFICSSKGRFPDLSDFTCQKYFLCSHLQNGSFIKTKYRCPNLSSFYPSSKQCSVKYICPCAITTSTSSPISFTTTTLLNLPTVENIKTTKTDSSEIPITTTASFENPTTSSNATYNYSNSTVGCTISYNEFQCIVVGRFPDLSDTTCRKYFLCSKLRNGTFIKTSYTCLNSTFNPLLFQCSVSYICSCNTEYASVTTAIHSISTSEGFTKISTTTSPVITTTSYTCISHSGNVPEFHCSSIGRFPDYSDITCRKYFLCSQLQNGTFVKTSYSCPATSCINSSIQRCSSSCKCPCLL